MIELRGVSKTVTSGDRPLTILHPLDLTIASGQFLAVLGASGSGKSTLLGLVAGLDAPTTGEILIDDVDIAKLSEDALARLRGAKIGFVFQFFHLVPSLTAYENILIPMEIARRRDASARAKRLLGEVGLDDRGHHYPSQLSRRRTAANRDRPRAGERPADHPGGEPTGNLDSATGRLIMELLLDVRRTRQTTMMLVTHDADLAALADSRLVLRDGRPVETTMERPHELRAADGVREIRASGQRLLFLHLHRHRRGGDHRAALGDPERAHRSVARGAVAHRRGHALTSNRDFTPKVLETWRRNRRRAASPPPPPRSRFRRWSGRPIRPKSSPGW